MPRGVAGDSTHTDTHAHLPHRTMRTRHAQGCSGTGRAGVDSRRSGREVAGEEAAAAPRPRTPAIHNNESRFSRCRTRS